MIKTERNDYIDVLKAFAILLVAVGHSIQFGSGEIYLQYGLFYENWLFKIIYSFHMPLFMLVSGYLFYYSTLKYSFMNNIRNRIQKLLIPILFWSILPFLLNLGQLQEYSLTRIVKTYIRTAISNLWFLWAILLCSIIVLAVKRFCGDSIYIYVIGLVITFFIPDILGSYCYKFMYPYFIIGYLANRDSDKIGNLVPKKKNSILLCVTILGILFAGLLLFYNRDSYIYTSHYYIWGENKPWTQLGIDIYRFLIGLVGSILACIMVRVIYCRIPEGLLKKIAFIGISSLGIYIVSGYIFSFVLPEITGQLPGINYGFTLLETVIIMSLSFFVTQMIRKSEILNKILLGGR